MNSTLLKSLLYFSSAFFGLFLAVGITYALSTDTISPLPVSIIDQPVTITVDPSIISLCTKILSSTVHVTLPKSSTSDIQTISPVLYPALIKSPYTSFSTQVTQ